MFRAVGAIPVCLRNGTVTLTWTGRSSGGEWVLFIAAFMELDREQDQIVAQSLFTGERKVNSHQLTVKVVADNDMKLEDSSSEAISVTVTPEVDRFTVPG